MSSNALRLFRVKAIILNSFVISQILPNVSRKLQTIKFFSVSLRKDRLAIAGQGGGAEILGLKRTTLQAKMKKLGIKRSNKEVPK